MGYHDERMFADFSRDRGKELEENGFGVCLKKKGEAVTAPP
jgi:hypothetical protein